MTSPLFPTLLITVAGLCISPANSGYPWPTPNWHHFYRKTTTPSSVIAGSANITSSETHSTGIGNDANSLPGSGKFCSTEVCKLTGKRIADSMNFSVDPCDDFFNYACGTFVATRTIPDNETEASGFKDLTEKMKLKVQDMLAEKKQNMFQSEVKIKSIFAQCKNQDEIEQLGAKPLIQLLNDEIGGWPVLNPNWNASNFDLFKALAKIKEHGDEPFFSVTIDQDMENPASNLIFITEPDTFATKDVLLSEAGKLYMESYITYVFNVTTLILKEVGDSRNVSDVAGQLTDQFDLGRYISLSGQTAVEKRDLSELKNKTTLGANQKKTFTRSSLFQRMTELIKAFFDYVDLSDKINADTTVILRYSRFFDRIDEKLLELERLGADGTRRLANYIGWRIITSNVPYMSKVYRDAYESHVQRIHGQKDKKQKTAAERCAKDVVEAMPLAAGAIFVRDMLPVDLKPKASMMVNDIKMGFKELLTEATWMDNATFTMAVRKLDAMLSFVAYPDVLVNNISAIDAEYQDMSVGSTYFMTVQDISKVKMMKNLRKLVKKNKRDDPIEDAVDVTAVNAYNLIYKNFIVVLGGILQMPFYETRNPEYLNYGGIGFVIGHEITHGFDDQGAAFDEEGQMRTWWTNTTTLAYNIKKQTFVDQYNAFNVSGGHINGELTLGENIADNGGLKAAYRAYFNHYQPRLSAAELLLPGFPNVTAEQMFFISSGQVWCGKKRPEAERLSLLTDEHSPFQARVVGPLSNMPEFAKAFNCPAGSTMNPTVKRIVW